MSSKIWVPVVLFVISAFVANEAIIWYTHNSVPANAATTASPQPFNTRLVDFRLPDTDGVVHDIHEWDNRIKLLNFWATWCPPCLKETPLFVELQEKYQKQGVQFIGVAIDNLNDVKDFMDTYGINYPILIGAEDAIEIAKKYGNRIGALPYSVLINRDGTIVYAQSGEMKREKLESLIKSLLSS